MDGKMSPEKRKINYWNKPRPFEIKVDGGVKCEMIASKSELEKLRALGYQIEPILHIDPYIYGVSYVELPEGNGSRDCEICEDSQNPPLGVLRGDRQVRFGDGTTRIICHFHNKQLEKESEVYRG